MKRAIIVGASTVSGLAAVLLLNPEGVPTPVAQVEADAQASTTAPDSTASATPSDTATNDPATNDTATSGSTTDTSQSGTSGTYSGDPIQVRNFGIMQVQVTVSDGKITDVTSLQVPDWDHKSQSINSYAVPQLVASALSSQSADVSYVSGATFTSQGFAESLQSALAKAGLG